MQTKHALGNHARWLLLAGALAAATAAHAQQAVKKKFTCWNENGTRVCGDSIPSGVLNQAHEEFNASGRQTARVDRALTAAEQAAADAAAKQQQADALAEQNRKRSEEAMLNSYASEADLRRAFDERRAMIDNDIKTARFNIDSQRQGLEMVLRGAGEKELSGTKANDKVIADIRKRHDALLAEQAREAGFEQQKKDLQAAAESALARWREMKGIADPNAPAAAPTTTASTAPAPGTHGMR